MIRYELTTARGKVVLSIAASTRDASAAIELSGDANAIEDVERDLARSFGAQGRRLDDAASPEDLEAAVQTMPLRLYKPRLLT